MTTEPTPAVWWQLTPQQRAMLERLRRDGPLRKPERWEMRTIRSLLARGLLRPRDPGRDRTGITGAWFLTARAARLVAGGHGSAAQRERGSDGDLARTGDTG